MIQWRKEISQIHIYSCQWEHPLNILIWPSFLNFWRDLHNLNCFHFHIMSFLQFSSTQNTSKLPNQASWGPKNNVFWPNCFLPPLIYYAFNGHFCHYFQHSLVDINFFARTVSYTFLEMSFKPEYSVHGIGCNFWKSKLSPDPSWECLIELLSQVTIVCRLSDLLGRIIWSP